MFSLKPDYEVSKSRYDAWWNGQIIDRPPVCLPLPVEHPAPVPQREYATQRERWLDVDFRAECADIELSNVRYLGDALPIVFPNMGPEIFSACCGCAYNFGETTTWTEPCLLDWAEADRYVLDWQHPLLKAVDDFTQALLARGKDKFIVGITDLHPGGDHLAALRDPQRLATDLLDYPDQVSAKLAASYPEYFALYDYFYEKLRAVGMPTTSWTPLPVDGTFYIPSNDFSCMISTAMFEQFFLQGIVDECNYYDRSIYHLDGPDALRHLDLLLEIPSLDAVQWVFGAGNEGYARWIPVYQKIQAKRKSIQLLCDVSELPLVFETLRPEGVWFSQITGVEDEETAREVLRRIERWA